MKKQFKLKRHDKYDKYIIVVDSDGWEIYFDYDDVPGGTYSKIKKIIRILNKNWSRYND